MDFIVNEKEQDTFPASWNYLLINDLVKSNYIVFQNGFPSGDWNDEGLGIPQIRPFNVTSNGNINLSELKFIQPKKDVSKYFINKGDIIFNNTNSEELVGKTAYWDYDGKFVLSNHMTIIRVLDESIVEPKYFALLLHKKWFDKYYKSICRRHVNQASISIERLKELKILLPPLPEQKAIAHILSTIQEAKEKTEAVIQATKELKKSMMKHLFTYGAVPVDEVDKVKLKETEIGLIPEDWQIHSLNSIGKVITGTTPKTKVKENYGNEFMFISPADMGQFKYIYSSDKHISLLGLEASRPLPKDSVLVVCIGATIGKTGMTFADKCATNQQINAIVANEEVNPHYLYYILSFHSKRIISMAGRGTMPIINKSNFEQLNIPVASIETQNKIATILSSIDDKLSSEKNSLAQMNCLFRSLLYYLMTGKIRVGSQ